MPSVIRGDDNFDSTLSLPKTFDLTNATVDKVLNVGDTVVINGKPLSNTVGVPLHVAVAAGQVYELYMETDFGTIVGDGVTYLHLNNTVYANSFIFRHINHYNTIFQAAWAASDTSFRIGHGTTRVNTSRVILSVGDSVNTYQHKMQSVSSGQATYHRDGVLSGVNYVALPWTSMGTIIQSVANVCTCNVIIKRIR